MRSAPESVLRFQARSTILTVVFERVDVSRKLFFNKSQIIRLCGASAVVAIGAGGCGNNPYPEADAHKKIFYGSITQSYNLDPVSAMTPWGLPFVGPVCESLFEYHYLKRPLELQPLLAKRIPEFERISEPGLHPGDPPRNLYRLRFEIWDQVLFHRSVCFDAPYFKTPRTRELTADDFEFAYLRIADPNWNCPVYSSFARIDGLTDWTARIEAIRREDPDADAMPISRLYARAGRIRGVRVTGRYSFDLILTEKFPILLYWLAYATASPVPPEAVEYYDGKGGRPRLRDWPIGTGPYLMAEHRIDEFIALDKNPDWRGITQPQRRLPGTRYPSEGEPGDRQAGRLDPAYVDRPLPFIDRYEYRRDKEVVTRFGKFLQGYYDAQELIEDTFHQAVSGLQLTPALADRGIRLSKETMLRDLYYVFNMNDDIVGAPQVFADPQRERDRDLWIARNRKLRQALCLAYDTDEEIEIFENGLGIKAESPLPPGFFGYDPGYRNPYRQYDPSLTRARKLLAEAGYPNGIDPKTAQPLKIVLSMPGTSVGQMELFKLAARMFGRLGIDLELDALTYNAFIQKLSRGNYQLVSWAWSADYPDPETFLMKLYGPQSSAGTGLKNRANFKNARYDFLYEKMVTLTDDESATWTEPADDGTVRTVTMSRYEIIREMLAIFEYECPWIINFHPQSYTLLHGWYHNSKPNTLIYNAKKYLDIDPELRYRKRQAWNRPVYWPAYVFGVLLILLVVPAVRTYIRRTRQ